MVFYLDSLVEEEHLLAVLTKMTGLSFARIRQANKQIHLLAEEKAKKFRVRATGFCDFSRKITYNMSGFILDTICLRCENRIIYTRHNDLVQPILENWRQGRRAVKVEYVMTLHTLATFKPRIIIAHERFTHCEMVPFELLISNDLSHRHGEAQKVLVEPLDKESGIVQQTSLLKLLKKWDRRATHPLRIAQVNKIMPAEKKDLEAIASFVCRNVTMRSVEKEDWGNRKVMAVKMTSSDGLRSAVAAFWFDEAEKNYGCKMYFDYSGDVTPEMLDLNLIYNE